MSWTISADTVVARTGGVVTDTIRGRSGAAVSISGAVVLEKLRPSNPTDGLQVDNFKFVGGQLILPAEPVGTSSAVSKSYVDTQVVSGVTSVLESKSGAPGGLATLGPDGLVLSTQLPSSTGGAVSSVNGKVGTVVLSTGDVAETSNLYFTDARVNANPTVAASVSHASNAAIHRSINDAGLSNTDLWSAAQISGQLAGKASSVHTHVSADITDLSATVNSAVSAAIGPTIQADVAAAVAPAVTAQLATLTTSAVAEGTNLYYTDARVTAVVAPAVTAAVSSLTTNSVTEGTNLYYTDARAVAATTPVVNSAVSSALATLTTSNVSEGTNLYYTDARATTAANAVVGPAVTAAVGPAVTTALSTLTTSNVSEGTNLYYTDARVVAAATPVVNSAVSSALAALTTSNVPEGTNLYYTDARAVAATTPVVNSAVSSAVGPAVTTALSTLTTSSVAEGSNLYYTDARVNANANVTSCVSHASNAAIHRSINDAGTSNTDLWSAAQISSQLAGKAATVHTHTAAQVQAYDNISYPAATMNTTYSDMFQFIWPGTANKSPIMAAYVIASVQAGTATSYSVRIFDKTNNQQIAELTGSNNTADAILNLGAISNLPVNQAILAVQALRVDGAGESVSVTALQLSY